MKTRVGSYCLAAIGLAVTVLAAYGWTDVSAPSTMPCGHQGTCLCVPNVRNYGYYPTQWRRWATEVRRDEHFPRSVGRERIPTPPGEPTEPLPIERVPSRPIPGMGEFPVPDGILPPEGPFQPEIPLIPEEPAIPGGIPFVPSTTPGVPPDTGIPGLPRPKPLESPMAEPDMPGSPQSSQQPHKPLESEGESNASIQSEVAPVTPTRGTPLRQPDSWAAQTQPRRDGLQDREAVAHEIPVRPAEHRSTGSPAPAPETMGMMAAAALPVAAEFPDSKLVSESSEAVAHEIPTRPAEHRPTGPPAPAPETMGMMAAAAPPVAAEFPDSKLVSESALALEGFCPVTLANSEQWQQGRREYMATYQDRTFYMAGPDERRQFLANPHHFAPMFGGIDPVLVVDEQRWTPGSIQYSATYKGRIYMLSSEANLKRFHENPRRYAFELDE